MRFVSMAFFLLSLHLAMAIVNGMGVFSPMLAPSNDLIGAVTATTVSDSSYSQSQASQQQSFGFGDFIKSLFFFVTGFAMTLIAMPLTFIQFGVPSWLAYVISTPIYAVYLFALAQWIGNRSEKSMG